MIGVEGRTVITEAVSWGRDPDDKSRQVFVPGGLGTNTSEAFANPRSDASSAVPRPVDSTGLVRFAGGTELREVVRRFLCGNHQASRTDYRGRAFREVRSRRVRGLRATIKAKPTEVPDVGADLAMQIAGLDDQRAAPIHVLFTVRSPWLTARQK